MRKLTTWAVLLLMIFSSFMTASAGSIWDGAAEYGRQLDDIGNDSVPMMSDEAIRTAKKSYKKLDYYKAQDAGFLESIKYRFDATIYVNLYKSVDNNYVELGLEVLGGQYDKLAIVAKIENAKLSYMLPGMQYTFYGETFGFREAFVGESVVRAC